MAVEFDLDIAELRAVEQRMRDGMPEVWEGVADELADRARDRCPVRTGTLRDSIEATSSTEGCEVEATARYAAFQDPFLPTPEEAVDLAAEKYMDGLMGGT